MAAPTRDCGQAALYSCLYHALVSPSCLLVKCNGEGPSSHLSPSVLQFMMAWQSQQAWQTHRVASSCLLLGHTQVSWLSPWHQTQWAALPERLLGFWVALAESGCFFSGLRLSRETAWWFCALKCQGRGLLCCCGVMAEQRAEQRGLPSSQSLAENSRHPEVEPSWDGGGRPSPPANQLKVGGPESESRFHSPSIFPAWRVNAMSLASFFLRRNK